MDNTQVIPCIGCGTADPEKFENPYDDGVCIACEAEAQKASDQAEAESFERGA